MAEIKEKNPLEVTDKGYALIMALREAGDGHTAQEIAEMMGITPQSVNGTFTSLSTRREKAGLPVIGERAVAEVEDAEGKKSEVKFLNLTEFGKTAEFVK